MGALWHGHHVQLCSMWTAQKLLPRTEAGAEIHPSAYCAMVTTLCKTCLEEGCPFLPTKPSHESVGLCDQKVLFCILYTFILNPSSSLVYRLWTPWVPSRAFPDFPLNPTLAPRLSFSFHLGASKVLSISIFLTAHTRKRPRQNTPLSAPARPAISVRPSLHC